MRYPLGTSAATVTSAPLLLVDVEMQEGVIGRSYLFCYRKSGAKAIVTILDEAVELVAGRPASPVDISAYLARRYALLGVTGTVRMALAALDIATWDAIAIAADMPLATLLGSRLNPVRAYNSDGLGLMPAADAANEAKLLLQAGFDAVKLRLGHPDSAQDLEVARAVRRAVPDTAAVMVDYNQCLTVPETIRRAEQLSDLDIYWIEEPIRHGDLRGCAAIARELRVPVQIGENLDGPEAVSDALSVDASDYLMLDVARIGGVTGWLRAAGIAAARGIPISSHLMPEISVHLLAATPNCHWLEYVSWAESILEEPMIVSNGFVTPPDRPGLGLNWRKDVGRFEAA
jgi:mandelate racemase